MSAGRHPHHHQPSSGYSVQGWRPWPLRVKWWKQWETGKVPLISLTLTMQLLQCVTYCKSQFAPKHPPVHIFPHGKVPLISLTLTMQLLQCVTYCKSQFAPKRPPVHIFPHGCIHLLHYWAKYRKIMKNCCEFWYTCKVVCDAGN